MLPISKRIKITEYCLPPELRGKGIKLPKSTMVYQKLVCHSAWGSLPENIAKVEYDSLDVPSVTIRSEIYFWG